MNAQQKQEPEWVNRRDECAQLKSRMRAIANRTLSLYGFAAIALMGAVTAARADLPPAYSQCANADANPAAAVTACSAIIQSGRDNGRNLAISYTNRAIGLAKQAQFDLAISDLNRALSLDPNYARAYNVRGIVYAKKGSLDQAINDLDQVIRINPQFAPAYYNRALAYRNKHDLDRALADLNQAVTINPGYALALFNRALVWRDKGEIDRAIADLNDGLRFDPRNAAAYAHRGQLYERKGSRLQALTDFRSALDIDPAQSLALAGRERLTASPVVADTRATDGRHPSEGPPAPAAPTTTGSVTPTPQLPVASKPAPPAASEPRAIPAPSPSAPKVGQLNPPAVNVPLPVSRPVVARSLTEALAACSKLGDSGSKGAIEIANGKGNVVLPASYHGRRHLDCLVSALVEEATAIDHDYGEIVRANYPDLRDAKSICRIEQTRLEDHIGRAKTFDARAALLQKSFTANASLIEEVREALRGIDLSSQTDSAALMKSILDEISGLIEQAAARQQDVLRLMQRIEVSRKAMATVQNIRKAICQ